MSAIEGIRRKVRSRDYYLSSHVEDEMAEDGFDRADVENAILRGLSRRDSRTTHGERDIESIEGPARDDRLMHAVCRVHEAGGLIIITVYAKE